MRRDILQVLKPFAVCWQVLMGVGKVISKGGDAAMGELSNQATVIEKGAHAHVRKSREAGPKPNVLAAMRAAWNHLRGWLVGILAAIISTLYTVSGPGVLHFLMLAAYPFTCCPAAVKLTRARGRMMCW